MVNTHKTLLFVGAHPDDETFGPGASLAQYAYSGASVYYLCSTRGEAGTVDPGLLNNYQSIGDLRWDELTRAAKVLSLKDFFHLGYSDSGMPGSVANKNPNALINAPLEEIAARMVKYFRLIKPDVIITHDSNGGYGHPDHIITHQAAVKAFFLSGNPDELKDAGSAFKPAKLYCTVRSSKLLKFVVRIMPLLGQNPHHFGRNKDIDLVNMLEIQQPIHARLRIKLKYIAIKQKAASCHASQLGGRPRNMWLMALINRFFNIYNIFFGYHDYYMRLYPEVKDKSMESDLFSDL
jgi:LmbE family N-acetylglucosaminyl deacetylase